MAPLRMNFYIVPVSQVSLTKWNHIPKPHNCGINFLTTQLYLHFNVDTHLSTSLHPYDSYNIDCYTPDLHVDSNHTPAPNTHLLEIMAFGPIIFSLVHSCLLIWNASNVYQIFFTVPKAEQACYSKTVCKTTSCQFTLQFTDKSFLFVLHVNEYSQYMKFLL